MSSRKIIPLLLLIACLVAGCQTRSDILPVNTPSPAVDEQPRFTGTLRVGLHMFRWKNKPYTPVDLSTSDQMLKDRSMSFMEKHPGVEIEFIDVAYDRNFEQVLTDPDMMPDIIELTAFEARLLRDRLEDLTMRIEAEAVNWHGDYMNVIDLAKVDGDALLLPLTSNPLMVFYKPEEFKARGVPVPEEGWTLIDYAKIGRQLELAGLAHVPAWRLNDLEPFIDAFGGRLTDGEGRITGAFDSEETVMAFVRYAELLGAMTGGGQPSDGPGALYVARAASTLATTKEYAVAPLPAMSDGKRGNNAFMTGLAILKSSRQQELAWEYMRHLLGETGDEAMDNVVMYTMEKQWLVNNFRLGQEEPPVFGDTMRWMRSEIAQSPPASFDLVWYADIRDGLEPRRDLRQLYDYADAGTARIEIPAWGAELQSYVDTLKAP